MRKLLFIAFCFCLLAACNNERQLQQNQSEKESQIAFLAMDSSLHGKIEFYPDSITNLLARCVNRGEENNPYVSMDEEVGKYSVSFFPMEEISKVTFFFLSNSDGTGFTMSDCLLTKDGEEFSCADIQELMHCTSFLVYPKLDVPLRRESKIVFYPTDSLSHNVFEIHPDSIMNLLVRCVNRGEENNPYVILDEEACMYSMSFFPMEESISKVVFFFSSNPDGTDISLKDCLVTLGDCEMFECSDIQRLDHCTSFILYPELDGPLMKGFVPKNE